MNAPRTILMVLALIAAAMPARSAFAQLRFCAGRPCPDGDKGGPSPAPVDGGRDGANDGPAPRAVLIDAVVLTPALEKANARLGIEQAVMAAIREEGWEPVSVTTDCKDLGCAGVAASAANAAYAVVLTGRFVKQEAYVADIGVSLWRSGSVVASRNEAQEEAASHREGGPAFFQCGPPSGVCTTKLLTTKLQQYAAGLLADENVAIRVRKKVAAAAPVAVPVVPAPGAIAVGTSPGEPGSGATGATVDDARRRRTLGWALVIGGGVLIGASIALWAIDETGVDCHGVVGDVDGCRKQLRTLPFAIGTGMAGVVAGAAGVGIFMWGGGGNQMTVSLKGNGLSLGGKF